MRELLRIAGPTVVTMSSYTLMTFTDKWLASRIGPEPIYVGAQGNGGISAWVPISIAHGVLTIVNTYVAQNMGAGQAQRGPAYAWNALYIGLAYWLLLLVPYGFALPWIFVQASGAGMDARQAELATVYGQILIFGACITLATRAFTQFFFGMHRAGIVMVAGVCANIFNLFISAVLVFGNAPPESLGWFGALTGWTAQLLGTPAMGIAGSALGTVLATLVELAIPLAVFLGRDMHQRFGTRSAWRPSWQRIKELLKLGWSQGLMFGNEMLCWSFFMVYLVSHFGRLHSTAGWIVHQYMSLSFMPAVGLSVATTALVGKYQGMGRSDLAQHRAWLAVKIALVYMGLCAVAFVVFREELVRFFIRADTPPEEAAMLIKLGGSFLIATAAFQLFDAVAMTLSGALRGAGDAVVPGVATIILSWLVIVGGGLAMIHFFPQLESLGGWIAAASYIAVLCLWLLGRFVSGKWKSIRLVERAEA